MGPIFLGKRMTTYRTGNPLGSVSVKDLYDNAENFDTAMNDRSADYWEDRLGHQRLSWHGAEEAIQRFLLSSGYQDLGDYEAGIVISSRNQIFRRGGELWRARAALELPYTTSGEWDDEGPSFVSVGDAALRQELAAASTSETGAALVGFLQSGTGAVGRTSLDKMRDTISVRDFISTPVDGVSDNQAGIERAISAAVARAAHVEWPDGTYVSSANIPGFHSVRHLGSGVIRRGTETWHVTPRGDQRNTLFVGGASSADNDGLSRSQPTTINAAFLRMMGLGDKAADGRWRIQLFGPISFNGDTLRDLPAFRNRLEIWGEAASLDSEPTTVWDGASSSAAYAIRGDWSTGDANVFLHFRNLKFINWQTSSLAGGICIWASGNILSENIWANNCSIGTWYRQCYVRQVYGKITNAATYAIAVQYGASGNIGDLAGGGITIENCGEGVNVGRQTNCYLQGNSFTGCAVDISCSRNSRIRPQGNTHTAWTNAVYYLQAGGILTPDNGQGNPDIFASTPSDAAPILRCESGSSHTSIHLRDRDMHSLNMGGSIATVSGTTDEVILAGASGAASGDFQPARVPAYWLYSPTATLRLEMFISTSNGAGGRLELRGAGTPVLAAIDIPVNASGRAGVVEFRIQRRPGATSGRFTVEFNSNLERIFTSGATASLNNAAIRAANESTLIYRLVWIPANTNLVQFADMVSYITA